MSATGFNLRRRQLEEEKEVTYEELLEKAKELNIKNAHSMKKETLKERLKEHGVKYTT